MKQLVDWNCHLLPMMGEWIRSPQDAREALVRLNARTGIRRFCMMAGFDCEKESLPCFLLERDRAVRELKTVLPEGYRIIPGGYVRLRPGVSEIRGVTKLCLPRSDLLPVLLPWNGMTQADALEWNRILYHLPVRPLIMEAEHFLTGYPKDDVGRLLHLRQAAYQFNYLSLTQPEIRFALRVLSVRQATVLFGTAVSSPGAAAYYDFRSAMEAASAAFGAARCEALLHAGIRQDQL